jgi:hypothetical protein
MTRADIEHDPVSFMQHLDATLALTSDQLNGKLDAIADTVDKHTVTLAEHTAKLNALKRTQDAHGEMLKEHGEMLQGHGDLLREILRRLPEPQ